MPTKIAINGFGRIGRPTLRIILDKHPDLEVVAINDLTDPKTLAHLLKYDSVYGTYNKAVSGSEGELLIGGKKIKVFSEADPSKLPWKELGVDVVLECTGFFNKDEKAKAHLKAGARKVILSAPAKGKGNVPTYILGVNFDRYHGENLISMASCTTNSIAPVTKVIEENFGIKKAVVTTVHAYTSTQNLVDGPNKDTRRARAADRRRRRWRS